MSRFLTIGILLFASCVLIASFFFRKDTTRKRLAAQRITHTRSIAPGKTYPGEKNLYVLWKPRSSAMQNGSRRKSILKSSGLKIVQDEKSALLEKAGISVVSAATHAMSATKTKLKKIPDVFTVEEEIFGTSSNTPNDPLYPTQWMLPRVGFPMWWNYRNPNPPENVVFVIIDSGYTPAHPDAPAHVTPGPNFIEGGTTSFDDCKHGTHVTGVSTASSNGVGIVGVNPDLSTITIRAAQAGGTNCSMSWSNLSAALVWVSDWVAEKGKKLVVTVSYGGEQPSVVLQNGINYLTYRGHVMTVSAMNTGNGPERAFYPCWSSGTDCVGAIAQNNTLASFSNWGNNRWVAPGKNIQTTDKNGTWVQVSGTSFASPAVGMVMATVWNEHPEWTKDQLRTQLAATADNTWNDPERYGNGIPRLDRSLGYPIRGAISGKATLQWEDGSFNVSPETSGLPLHVWAKNAQGQTFEGAITTTSNANFTIPNLPITDPSGTVFTIYGEILVKDPDGFWQTSLYANRQTVSLTRTNPVAAIERMNLYNVTPYTVSYYSLPYPNARFPYPSCEQACAQIYGDAGEKIGLCTNSPTQYPNPQAFSHPLTPVGPAPSGNAFCATSSGYCSLPGVSCTGTQCRCFR